MQARLAVQDDEVSLRALGVPRGISEMCLNHRLSGVEGIYDQHTYFDERKEALEK